MPIAYENTNAALEDAERRKRIESSPVKLFYKTVPLDEAGTLPLRFFHTKIQFLGITDTETPRPLVNGVKWTEQLDVPLAGEELSDSMIVQADNASVNVSVQDDYQVWFGGLLEIRNLGCHEHVGEPRGPVQYELGEVEARYAVERAEVDQEGVHLIVEG